MAILLICVIALVARLSYFLSVSTAPWYGYPVLDAQYLVAQAQYVWQHHAFPADPFFRPPMYTALLALVYGVAGQALVTAVAILQHLLGVAFCVLVYRLARHCWNPVAAFASGVMCALYAPLVFYEGETLSDVAALFLYTWFLLWWLRARDSRSIKHYVIAGVIAGVGCLTRPNLLLCVGVFVLVAAFIDAGRRVVLRQLTGIVTFAMATAIIVAIPSVRNAMHGDYNLICSQGGINFWVGNHQDANGLNVVLPNAIEQSGDYRDSVEEFGVLGYLQSRFGGAWFREVAAGVQAYQSGVRPQPSVVSKYWYTEARHWMANNPASTIQLYGKKLIGLISNLEVRNNREFQFFRHHVSTVLLLLPFTFGGLFAFGAAGLSLLRLRAAPSSLRWLLLHQVLAAAGILLYFVGGRLRLSLLPALLVCAGIAVDQILVAVSERCYNRLLPAAIAGAASALISFYSWPQVDFRYSSAQPQRLGIHATSNYAIEWSYLARGALAQGHSAAALEYAGAATKADPTLTFAWLLAGDAAAGKNDLSLASRNYRKALELEPAGTKALNNLAVIAERSRQWRVASFLYGTALQRNPANGTALGNYAMLVYRSGNTTASQAIARSALTFVPNLASAQAVLAAGGSTGASPRVQAMLDELRQPLPQDSLNTASMTLARSLDELTSAAASLSRGNNAVASPR